MQLFLASIVTFLMLLSCKNKENSKDLDQNQLKNSSVLKVIQLDPVSSTIEIDQYTFIESTGIDRQKDAAEIIDLKHKWPQVMQAPNILGFDTILAKNFTFYGEGRLLNREEYIQDRLRASDWIITFVKYDNLTLQFFDNIGLLTYKNHVTNKNIKTQEVEIEHINWSDIYVKENGKWKIEASHTIDVRIEPIEKGQN